MTKVNIVNTVEWFGNRLYLGDISNLYNGVLDLRYSYHKKGLFYLKHVTTPPGQKCSECIIRELCSKSRITAIYRGVECSICRIPGHNTVFRSLDDLLENI